MPVTKGEVQDFSVIKGEEQASNLTPETADVSDEQERE